MVAAEIVLWAVSHICVDQFEAASARSAYVDLAPTDGKNPFQRVAKTRDNLQNC